MRLRPITQLQDEPLITSAQYWSLPLLTVFALWVLVLLDPQMWVAGSTLNQVPKFIYFALAGMIILQASERVWYLPFLLFVLGGIVGSAFAENIGIAQDTMVKIVVLYYVLMIGSLTFIRSADKVTLLLNLFLFQFLWWSFHSRLGGRIPWHPTLGNQDGFGPLMVIGMGYSYYFGLATRKRSQRLMAFLISVLCVGGVVSSFARGAVLATGAIVGYGLFRSPQKGRTFAAVAVGVAVFLLASTVLFSDGSFWQEMSTISEGFEAGTGRDRKILWDMAWQEFLENPILGVGAGNFGIYASEHLWVEGIKGYRSHWHFYGRAVHNVYFQVLAEFGLVGTIAFAAMLIDFWKRNRQLRSPPFVTAWWLATQDRFDLRMLSLAVEVAMVGYLVSSFFYDQLFVHWFYTILMVNLVLHSNAKRVVLQQRRAFPSE